MDTYRTSVPRSRAVAHSGSLRPSAFSAARSCSASRTSLPGYCQRGASPAAIPWIIVGNLLPGITYGIIYYLTRNVWYTGFVHGFGNATVVPFDPSAVPSFVPFAAFAGILIALGYRHLGVATRPETADGRNQPTTSTE